MKRLTYKHSISKPFIYLGLVALMMVVSLSDYCYASADMDPGSIDWGSVSLTTSFPKKVGSNLVLFTTKYYHATSSLINSHCKTDYGTKLEHYHFQNDFSGSDLTYANAFWDWFYPTSTRISGATDQTNCLCYAMDGYAGSANYDYWVDPGDEDHQGNDMFIDDCMIRDPIHEVDADDRLAYLCEYGIAHATIVLEESGNEPTCLEWKNNASGVYQFDPYGADPYSTPGCKDISYNPFTGTYEPDFYPGDNAVGFYEW